MSLIHSYLSYNITSWGSALKSHLKSVQSAQNLIIRISNLNFATDKIFNVYQIFINQTIKFLFKRPELLVPSEQSTYHNTRRPNKYLLPHRSLKVTQNHITYIGPKLINKIPTSILALPPTRKSLSIKEWILKETVSS